MATVNVSASVGDMAEVRSKFYDAARTMYPKVGEPGVVWVLTQVLGWSFEDVSRVAVDGFSRQSYRVFVLDENGNHEIKRFPNGHKEFVAVTREWTKAEKSKLKEWWWLLGF